MRMAPSYEVDHCVLIRSAPAIAVTAPSMTLHISNVVMRGRDADFGRVEIVRYGRVIAIVLSPRELQLISKPSAAPATEANAWRRNHMIPASLARSARRVLRNVADV